MATCRLDPRVLNKASLLPSTLTWLDYSERDRRRALDVIDLFRESGTVDEQLRLDHGLWKSTP